MIHRDIKPQNFVLVPVGSVVTERGLVPADRVLAETTTPREDFVFRMAGLSNGAKNSQNAEVELVLRDPITNAEQVVPLQIKLSDFGLAQPLELDASHLSLKGCFGTILYMAPETIRPVSLDPITGAPTKKVSFATDIWALGVILFQMLHECRTPFSAFYRTDGHIGVAVAASDRKVVEKVVCFGRGRSNNVLGEGES